MICVLVTSPVNMHVHRPLAIRKNDTKHYPLLYPLLPYRKTAQTMFEKSGRQTIHW